MATAARAKAREGKATVAVAAEVVAPVDSTAVGVDIQVAAARAPVATEMAEVEAADMAPEVLAVHGSPTWETLLAMQVPLEMPVVVMAEMAALVEVAAREGAAVWTAGTAGTAADTEHAGGSRSSRCRKCNTTTARRAHHLDRSRRRHTRMYWCS